MYKKHIHTHTHTHNKRLHSEQRGMHKADSPGISKYMYKCMYTFINTLAHTFICRLYVNVCTHTYTFTNVITDAFTWECVYAYLYI